MKEGKIKNFKLYRLMVFGVLILAYMVVFFHRLAVGIVREDLIRNSTCPILPLPT